MRSACWSAGGCRGEVDITFAARRSSSQREARRGWLVQVLGGERYGMELWSHGAAIAHHRGHPGPFLCPCGPDPCRPT